MRTVKYPFRLQYLLTRNESISVYFKTILNGLNFNFSVILAIGHSPHDSIPT